MRTRQERPPIERLSRPLQLPQFLDGCEVLPRHITTGKEREVLEALVGVQVGRRRVQHVELPAEHEDKLGVAIPHPERLVAKQLAGAETVARLTRFERPVDE